MYTIVRDKIVSIMGPTCDLEYLRPIEGKYSLTGIACADSDYCGIKRNVCGLIQIKYIFDSMNYRQKPYLHPSFWMSERKKIKNFYVSYEADTKNSYYKTSAGQDMTAYLVALTAEYGEEDLIPDILIGAYAAEELANTYYSQKDTEYYKTMQDFYDIAARKITDAEYPLWSEQSRTFLLSHGPERYTRKDRYNVKNIPDDIISSIKESFKYPIIVRISHDVLAHMELMLSYISLNTALNIRYFSLSGEKALAIGNYEEAYATWKEKNLKETKYGLSYKEFNPFLYDKISKIIEDFNQAMHSIERRE